MVDKLPFGECASINIPPLFCGVNYQFWKLRMKIFVESIDKGIWDAVKNGPFVPMLENHKMISKKPFLSSDEFFKVSQCELAKEMWDTL